MKLRDKIFSQILVYFTAIMGIWAVVFYFVIMDEVRDETDDYLQIYAQQIITLHNAGSEIPMQKFVSNNSYVLKEITQPEAQQLPSARFFEEEIYIPEKGETEPARTFQTIFGDTKGRFYMLKVSVPTVETRELQLAILFSILILISILLIILLFINFIVFRREMKPLYFLLKWLKNYTVGKKNTPTLETKSNIAEFKELYHAMNCSVKRNEDIFEQQKQFISNASHELQTPLAVCKNRLEMLLENDNIAENELAEIMKIKQSIDKSIQLNRTLLFLAKIENRQFVDDKIVNINDLIKLIIEDFQEIFAYKNITFEMEEHGILLLSINETLANSLISNLLKNAFVHNLSNGKILVRIDTEKIVFHNTGNHRELDRNLIFNRFYTEENNHNSSGLGLAIVKSICQNYNLTINYEFRGNEHIFSVEIMP